MLAAVGGVAVAVAVAGMRGDDAGCDARISGITWVALGSLAFLGVPSNGRKITTNAGEHWLVAWRAWWQCCKSSFWKLH